MHATAPFQQRCIPGKGVGLIAAQDITAGSVLLHEDALVAFTATAAEEWDALSSAVKRLSKPQQAAYRGLANSFAKQYPEARRPSNLLSMQHAEGADLHRSHTVTPSLSCVWRLAASWGIVWCIQWSGHGRQPAVLRTTQVYGVFRTNSFRLRDAGEAEAGTQHGIFPTVSRANHSCLPTCFVEFGSTTAVSLGAFCCGHLPHSHASSFDELLGGAAEYIDLTVKPEAVGVCTVQGLLCISLLQVTVLPS